MALPERDKTQFMNDVYAKYGAANAISVYMGAFPNKSELVRKYLEEYGSENTFNAIMGSLKPAEKAPRIVLPRAKKPSPFETIGKGALLAAESQIALGRTIREKLRRPTGQPLSAGEPVLTPEERKQPDKPSGLDIIGRSAVLQAEGQIEAGKFIIKNYRRFVDAPLTKLGVKERAAIRKGIARTRKWAGVLPGIDPLPTVEETKELISTRNWKELNDLAVRGRLPTADELGQDYLTGVASELSQLSKPEANASLRLLQHFTTSPTASWFRRGEVPSLVPKEFMAKHPLLSILPTTVQIIGEELFEPLTHPEQLPAVIVTYAATRGGLRWLAKQKWATTDLVKLWKAWRTTEKVTVTKQNWINFVSSIDDPAITPEVSAVLKNASPKDISRFAAQVRKKGSFKIGVPRGTAKPPAAVPAEVPLIGEPIERQAKVSPLAPAQEQPIAVKRVPPAEAPLAAVKAGRVAQVPEPTAEGGELSVALDKAATLSQNYNAAIKDSQARTAFLKNYNPVRFGTANAMERLRTPKLDPMFRTANDGIYYATTTGKGLDFSVVPRFDLTITEDVYGPGSMGQVFDMPGYDPKGRFDNVKVVEPAVFTYDTNKQEWILKKKGKLDLGVIEVAPIPPTVPTKPLNEYIGQLRDLGAADTQIPKILADHPLPTDRQAWQLTKAEYDAEYKALSHKIRYVDVPLQAKESLATAVTDIEQQLTAIDKATDAEVSKMFDELMAKNKAHWKVLKETKDSLAVGQGSKTFKYSSRRHFVNNTLRKRLKTLKRPSAIDNRMGDTAYKTQVEMRKRGFLGKDSMSRSAGEHKALVRTALEAGEQVPSHVLAEYPDLAGKAGIPPVEAQPTVPIEPPADIGMKPPVEEAGLFLEGDTEVTGLALEKAAEANSELDSARILYREIISGGGIKPYANGRELEEYKSHVPAHFRRKAGMTPDDMASELGFAGDTELYQEIDRSEMLRKGVEVSLPKGKRKFTAADFMDEAKGTLEDVFYSEIRDIVAEMDEASQALIVKSAGAAASDELTAFVGNLVGRTEDISAMAERHGSESVIDAIVQEIREKPLPGELFKMEKGKLKLEVEDIATSEDQLEIFLQRKGWDVGRVKELQASISSKLTPDMLTGRIESLSPGEIELQDDIQEFIDTTPRKTPPSQAIPPSAEVNALLTDVDKPIVAAIGDLRTGTNDKTVLKKLGEVTDQVDKVAGLAKEHGESVVLDEVVKQGSEPLPPENPVDATIRSNAKALKDRLTEKEQAGFIRFGKTQPTPEIEDPDLRAALYAGRKQTVHWEAFKGRIKDLGLDIKEFALAELDPALKKAMPQLWDDYRTGAIPVGMRAREKTEAALGGIWGDLDATQRDTLLNLMGMRSFLQSAGEGIEVSRELPAEVIQKDYDNLTAKTDPEVLAALERYRDFANVVGEDLVARGKLEAAALKDFYFPHKVLDFLPDWWENAPLRPGRIRDPFRAYTKKRAGSSKDIAISEEALATHFSQVFADNMLDDWALKQLELYDLTNKLSPADQKALFEGEPRVKPYEWQGEPYHGFQYNPGNSIFRAEAADLKLLKIAIQTAMEDAAVEAAGSADVTEALNRVRDLTSYEEIRDYLDNVRPPTGSVLDNAVKSALRPVAAIGKLRKVHVIPKPMYEKMKRFKDPSEYIPILYEIIGFTRFWKRLTLSPVGAGIPFQLGNLIGDFFNLWRTSSGATKEIPTAFRILKNMRTPEKLPPAEQKILANVLDKDVLGAGFLREYTTVNPLLSAKGWWRKYERLSGLREGLMRVAMTSYQMKLTAAGLPLKAPEFKSFTDKIDLDSGAAYIGRKFTVDYLDVPAYYRKYIQGIGLPFATFWQHNAPNWALYAAKAPAAFTGKFIAPIAAMWTYNNTGWRREVEEKLGYFRKRPFHLILKRHDLNNDGKYDHATIWAPQLPIEMAGEFVGANLIGDKITLVRAGMMTVEEAAKQQLYDMFLGTPKVTSQLLNPMIQLFVGLVANRDPFNKKPIVPNELRDLPDYQKLKYRIPYILEKLITPFGQYMRTANRDDLSVLELFVDVPAVLRPALKGPVDIPRGFGFYLVNLERAEAQRLLEIGREQRGKYTHYMYKFEQAYIESGEVDPTKFATSKAALNITKDAIDDDIITFPADVIKRLLSPRVQIDRYNELLRKEDDAKKRKELTHKKTQLLKLRAAEYLIRTPKGAFPALIKKLQKTRRAPRTPLEGEIEIREKVSPHARPEDQPIAIPRLNER